MGENRHAPMTATRLFLIRHGEVDAAWRGRIYGSLDVPLSDNGRREGLRVAAALQPIPIRLVVSSGLVRTEHLAACLRNGRGLQRVDDPALRELERGDWAGRTPSEVEARCPGAWEAWFTRPSSRRPPGGESLDDLWRRVSPRLEHWTRAHPAQHIAWITHGWVFRLLLCQVLGAPFDAAPRIDVRTGDVALLRWPNCSDQAPALDSFARLAHLRQLSE
jgi:broad specificity phosphatase PhoE